MFSHIYFCY
jgi:predicted RNase H-like nuclease (RuvC/YqgF family)